MHNLIGIDFSIVKTAACVLADNKYNFFVWPKDLKEKDIKILTNIDINVYPRYNIELKDKVRYEITNANILSDSIIDKLIPFINENTKIALEGASYASKGNAVISIMTWKYILIYKLSLLIPLENIFTFSPITIKSIAKCATKDKRGKGSMIAAFGEENINHPFCQIIKNKPDSLKKKINYISCIDDLSDSFWVLKTLIIKEKLDM